MSVTDQNILANYPGNKNMQGLTEKIINQIPPHSIYVEYFAGSAAVGRRKKPAPKENLYFDKDKRVVDALRNLGLNAYEDSFDKDVNGIFSKPGNDVFLFLDPPYPISYRLSKQQIYRYEMGDIQHVILLKKITRLDCMVMICTNPNPIYERYLKDWRKLEIDVNYHTQPAKEIIYMNYPEPTELHEYTFLGSDCWERQRIQRKIKRHIDRLNLLPPLERNAIVSQIKNMF